MDIWFVSFVGGLVGSVFMDYAEAKMAKFDISSGVTSAYIGRWLNGLLNGTLKHQNICDAAPVNHEIRNAQIFHFLIGGGAVALFYPLFLHFTGFDHTPNHFLLATLFGLITSVLPWFILMPSFGWGVFGIKAPIGSRPIISPILSHLAYGFGIGLTLVTYYAIKAYL